MPSTDAKDGLDRQTISIQDDLASADAKLFELNLEKAKHWKAHEVRVGAAIVRLHKSIENATGGPGHSEASIAANCPCSGVHGPGIERCVRKVMLSRT
jgi:hypothetical protein